MPNTPYKLKGDSRRDIAAIRKYTLKEWGEGQWAKYDAILFKRIQALANNPEMGLSIPEISDNAYRYPDGNHVFYYLRRKSDVVFVGILSSSMAPEKHLKRIRNIESELNF